MRPLIQVERRPERGAAQPSITASKLRVDLHLEAAAADGAGKPPRHMHAVERQDAAPLRLDPIERVVLGALGHGKDAAGIGLEQHLRRDLDHDVVDRGHADLPAGVGLGEMVLEPMDIVIAVDDFGLRDERGEQRDGGLDAVDDELAQRPLEPHQAFVAGAGMHDELADQAVVIRGNGVAGVGAANRP